MAMTSADTDTGRQLHTVLSTKLSVDIEGSVEEAERKQYALQRVRGICSASSVRSLFTAFTTTIIKLGRPSTMSMESSWSDTRGGDIIDLDRYMRSTVRPTAARSRQQRATCSPELVVDGGAALKATRGHKRHKRYSHDSGLSDTSYSRHRRLARPHRRQSNINETRVRESTRQNSSDSLRHFRAVCEQALLEQQRQIAHVTHLCEKLTQRAEQTERIERTELKEDKTEKNVDEKNDDGYETKRRQNPAETTTNDKTSSLRDSSPKCQSNLVKSDRHKAVCRREQVSSEVSDITSSSRSTRDPRRKDKHRSQQCRTYKLIMSKLEELNHVFASRAAASLAPRPRPASSTSVSVCDKVIATDAGYAHSPHDAAYKHCVGKGDLHNRQSERAPLPACRRVTQAYAVDIARPRPAPPAPLAILATDSAVKSAPVGGSTTSVGDPRCGFDLDDPVHLYSQAKRLQTLTVTTRRGRSLESRASSESRRDASDTRRARRDTRSVTLCAVCRGYWRSLRRCLAPMFSPPDHCHSSL